MKIFKKTLLSTLVIASIAALTACGGGGGDSSSPTNKNKPEGTDKDKKSPITQEFSATLPANHNNISGQSGFVSVQMQLPRGSLSSGKPTSNDYIESCKDLANGFNKTYNNIYKDAGVTNVYINSQAQTLKPVLSHAIDAEHADQCVLELGPGLVLRNDSGSLKNKKWSDIIQNGQGKGPAVGIQYTNGSVKLEDHAKFELIGVVNYDENKNKISLMQSSKVDNIYYNHYKIEKSSNKYKFDRSGSDNLSDDHDAMGVDFKAPGQAHQANVIPPHDVSGVYWANKDDVEKLVKNAKNNQFALMYTGHLIFAIDGEVKQLSFFDIKVSATHPKWSGEANDTYFNYRVKDKVYSIYTLNQPSK